MYCSALLLLQVDVIESQFCHLLNRIKSDQEAELVQSAHEAYLASMQAQALLFHPTAKPCILRLLSICRIFLGTSIATEAAASEDGDRLSVNEESLLREFHQQSRRLFYCLSGFSLTGALSGIGLECGSRRYGHLGAPTADISQFLLRLDFNQFYSNSSSTVEGSP